MKDKIKHKTKKEIINNKNTTLVRRNHHFQVWQLEWMEAHKRETGTSAAELLRRLISKYVENNDR